MTEQETEQEEVLPFEEPECVLDYCRTCKKETQHIVVGAGERLLCTICKVFRPNNNTHKPIPKTTPTELKEIRALSMDEFYESLTNTQVNQGEDRI